MIRNGYIYFAGSLVAFCCAMAGANAIAQRDEIPADYPRSLEPALRSLLDRLDRHPASPVLLVRLAETYMDLADDLLTDETPRRVAYEAGAKAAKQAFEVDDSNADAHFLHAANLGSAERLKGLTNAALAVNEIKRHVQRAIELDSKHAQALQMMGGLLMELPWFLGGDDKMAQEYLERAIAADGNFTNARILLAKLYKKQDRVEDAKRQLEAVIHASHPHYPYTWSRKFKPEAERLLQEMKKLLR